MGGLFWESVHVVSRQATHPHLHRIRKHLMHSHDFLTCTLLTKIDIYVLACIRLKRISQICLMPACSYNLCLVYTEVVIGVSRILSFLCFFPFLLSVIRQLVGNVLQLPQNI